MTDDLEQRVIELEQRLAFFERTVEDLSDVVVEQARTIELLDRQLTELIERLRDAAEWRPPPQDEKPPPHY